MMELAFVCNVTSFTKRKYEASTSGEQSPATSRPLYYITSGRHLDIVWPVLRMVRIISAMMKREEKIAPSIDLHYIIIYKAKLLLPMSCFSAISNTTWFQLSKIKGFRHGDVIRSLQVTPSLHSPTPASTAAGISQIINRN